MRSREFFKPNLVIVAGDSKEDSLTKNVISRLPNATIEYVDDFKSIGELEKNIFTKYLSTKYQASYDDIPTDIKFSEGKRVLILTRHKGNWIKSCPGTSSHVCCNLFTVDPGEGCPLDCTYCYLQSYLKANPTLKLYSNTSDLLHELSEKFTSEPGRLFRVGTGELIDSLVWDDLTDFSKEIVPFFAKFPNAVLELKSKDDYVANLVDLKDEHNGKTVVSWSINAPSVSGKDEKSTASVDERIAAAKKVVEAGYRVGFHFDPLVYFEGWEEEYSELIERVFSQISPENVAWVSISSLRYQGNLQEMMMKRFPDSLLPYGEQFMAKDSKLRYIQPIRFKLVRFVWNKLKEVSDTLPVYMCMESSAAWKEIAGGSPVAGDEIKEIFSRRVILPVLN